MTQPDRIVSEPERRQLTGLSRSTWWRLEREGLVPKRRKLSRNRVGWSLAALMAWLDETEEAA